MYCPQCATPNAGELKFCRSCGTELEAVALALSGKSAQPVKAITKKSEHKTAQDWLEKRIEGVSGISRGAILLAVPLLIGVCLALFLPSSFNVPWILIWVVFFGWMAVWGGIEMAYGVSGVLESKSRLHMMELTDKKSAGDTTPQQSLSSGETSEIMNRSAGFRTSPPVSVIEETTKQMEDYVEK